MLELSPSAKSVALLEGPDNSYDTSVLSQPSLNSSIYNLRSLREPYLAPKPLIKPLLLPTSCASNFTIRECFASARSDAYTFTSASPNTFTHIDLNTFACLSFRLSPSTHRYQRRFPYDCCHLRRLRCPFPSSTRLATEGHHHRQHAYAVLFRAPGAIKYQESEPTKYRNQARFSIQYQSMHRRAPLVRSYSRTGKSLRG
ncbi:hypothetical protein BD779DRAFT_292382 [Infundibulicybe gibba]|nr:hypothetical protein BD779DRAFT_292382 [Infundibulicybe gibba]